MNLILLELDEVDARGLVCLRDARAAHIREVLHAVPGQTVHVGVIDGATGTATVQSVEGDTVTLRCTLEAGIAPSPSIDLLLALPRPKVMKRLWSPLAQLGVRHVILTNAAKVERAYFDTHWLEPQHYRPLLIEGLQQVGSTRLPRVTIRRRFRPLVEDELDALSPGAVRLLADPVARERIGACGLARGRAVLLAIGPEGGWTDFERSLLVENGFRGVQVAAGTLRSDVACVVTLGLVLDQMAL